MRTEKGEREPGRCGTNSFSMQLAVDAPEMPRWHRRLPDATSQRCHVALTVLGCPLRGHLQLANATPAQRY